MPKSKRYYFFVVEEAIMNPDNKYYRGGRIEVYDCKDKGKYACYEARFLISMRKRRNGFQFKFNRRSTKKHYRVPITIADRMSCEGSDARWDGYARVLYKCALSKGIWGIRGHTT